MVADKEGPEIFAPAFRERITADNELLGFGDLVFDQAHRFNGRFHRLNSVFGDQSLEAKLLSDAEQLIFGAA